MGADCCFSVRDGAGLHTQKDRPIDLSDGRDASIGADLHGRRTHLVGHS